VTAIGVMLLTFKENHKKSNAEYCELLVIARRVYDYHFDFHVQHELVT
jgi:hypothetical protein